MTTLDFSITQNLQFLRNNNSLTSGCYILYQNHAIPRIGGEDSKGILYIGKGDNILKRVGSLQKSVLDNCLDKEKPTIRGHKSLSKKVYRIQKFIKTETLTIKILAPTHMHDVRYLESFLIESYVQKYGELPPLNGQYGSYSLLDAKEYLEGININLKTLNPIF